jgi:hypothetical protein
MDHAANRAVVSHEMSTDNVGSILPAERSTLVGRHDLGERSQPVGRESRNAFMEPGGFMEGVTGDMGVNDAMNNGWD